MLEYFIIAAGVAGAFATGFFVGAKNVKTAAAVTAAATAAQTAATAAATAVKKL